MKILTSLACAAALLAAAFPGAAGARDAAAFPNKPVTLVVPFTASSGSDIIARIIAPKLEARWGQPVIVVNKPGASGDIGARQVAVAAPDGYTLLMAINTFTMTPSLYRKLPFDPIRSFAPVAKLATAGFTFAVNPKVPAHDVKSLIAYVKTQDGHVNYATPGTGTPQHLAMELFKSHLGLQIAHVPYKGIAGALTGLVGGEVQMMFTTVHTMLPFLKDKRVRLLAVSGAQRDPLIPDVPTFREQGIDFMDGVDAWYGVMAPAGTPPAIVERLNGDFVAVMSSSQVKAQLADMGLSVHTSSAAEFSSLIKHDLVRWKKVVETAGITAQ
ncbi:tripartite tricarboxylate transporter substrate binding protein [Candidimonas humi]|jgi:tripartite-type tricarboxylate transporter receptor subunit TctC|uniref:Bug family tripartite tricarboxylate transporter substrate binding protein n=1 Tax=Candidimonas humi TaxID=683355 RepID=A0ABV8NWR3_9BURK|nr:tripartite tricarboxylate transporter substrate binding protein [Candidimonas humi]MBV6307052.1 tripartite tricarboxylate transporter substrate binding protein [Candidimonas humi]